MPNTQDAAPRIALVLPDLGAGGAERVSLILAAQLLRRGFAVDLVLFQARGALIEAAPEGARIVDLGAAKLRAGIWPLAHYLRRTRPTALIANMWPLTLAAILAHRLARSRAKLAVVEHVDWSEPLARGGRLHRMFWRASMRRLYPLADRRIAVSQGAALDLARGAGLRLDSVDLAYNPVEPPRTSIEAVRRAQEAWGAQTGARILSVGTLKPQKNHRLLLQAFALLRAGRPARLVLVGDGALREALQAEAQRLGIAQDVVFAGFSDAPAPFYESADLFVCSSDYEGMCVVLVEAMACGTPVVSTDCPSGPAELLARGRYGTLVPCGGAEALSQAMGCTLDAPSDPERLRARAAEFGPAPMTERYLELLDLKPPREEKAP